MRPAGRGPLDSLYFNYPRFEPRRVPDLAGGGARARVAIVGAGPIGMTAALALARHGVKSVLLDNKSTFNDGSRAICIARQSMNILRQIGAVDPFEKHALGWTHGTSTYRGHKILRLSMPHSANERYLPMYNLQQQYTEKYLHDAVARSPLIDMRWCNEVVGHRTAERRCHAERVIAARSVCPGGRLRPRRGWCAQPLALDARPQAERRELRGQLRHR